MLEILSRKYVRRAIDRSGIAIGVAGIVCGAASAQRDITYGGDARAFAMGGAGIALLQDLQSGGTRVNPATLAFEKQPVGVNFPSFAIRAQGPISIGGASNYLLKGQSLSDAASLTREFASEDSEFGINANTSLRIGKVEIGGAAVARGRLQPNAALQQWVASGRPNNALPLSARSDIFAAGYYTLPSISLATTLPVSPNKPYNFAVGVRLKYMTAVYTHYVADAQALAGLNEPPLAPEMGGKESLTKKGVGADVGAFVKQRSDDGLSGAVILANAISPNFKFDGTDRNGNPFRYNLVVSSVSTGAGYQKKGTTLAADLVDITQNVGARQIRLGAEQRFGGKLALRGGYSSATGFTYGVGFFGLDVAFGKSQPLEVVRTLNF